MNSTDSNSSTTIPKWRITYTLDKHYRDEDNYTAIDTGELQYVYGKRPGIAAVNLIKQLSTNGHLNAVVDAVAKNLKAFNEYYSVTIVSVDLVHAENEIDFYEMPIFKNLVRARKREIAKEAQLRQKRIDKRTEEQELMQLARLKRKYEKD